MAGITNQNKYNEAVFVNPDAMDLRTKRWLAKLIPSVLKAAGEIAIAPELFVPNPLTAEMGTEGKFYDWGQLVAVLKGDGVPTGVQKPKPEEAAYSLDEYEVKVGITDRAKINSQMQAQDLLTAGNSGRAFARAFDAHSFNVVKADMQSTGGTNWSTAADADVLDQLDGMLGTVEDEGFDADALILTRKQRSRISKIGLTYANPLTAEELILKEHPDIKKIYRWRKIQVKNPDGTTWGLFDPTGYAFAIDTKGCGVFTQRPVTAEKFRDVDAGVDFAYLRKYFQTSLVQLNAGHMLTGLVI